MGEVTITVNGRPYRMACEDGQEPHLRGLGADLANRVQELAGQVGKVGDAQLLVMAALIAADEAQVASTAGGGAGDDEAVRSLMAERDALIAERDAALAALMRRKRRRASAPIQRPPKQRSRPPRKPGTPWRPTWRAPKLRDRRCWRKGMR